MDTAVVIEIIKKANEYKILVDQLIEMAEPSINQLADLSVDTRARMVSRFINDHNFSREEALLMTLDIQTSILKATGKT